MRRVTLLLATGLGLGLSPVASGTAGALLGVPLAFAMGSLGWVAQAVICACLVCVAVPLCSAGEEYLGRKDDGRIVADEYLTFPICLIGLPCVQYLWLLGMAFVVNRLMDILKPPPARQAQDLQGGLGIVIDDTISSLYALGINHALFWVVLRYVL